VGYDADARQMDKLNKATGIVPTGSVGEAVKQADVVVLAVKPQIMPAVLQEMAGSLSGQLVITIAAGLALTYYEEMLSSDTPLVRVMPSLNARALAACSAVCANAQATATQLDTAKKLFAAVGTVHEVPEKLFPAFSALAGAAPAFAFEMVDALGQRNGSAAMRLFHGLLGEGKEPLYVFSMIARQFRLLLQAKSLAEQQAALPQLMKELGLRHEFVATKLLAQARNFSLGRLQGIYRELQRIDVAIKTGRVEPELALDVFITEVCGDERARPSVPRRGGGAP